MNEKSYPFVTDGRTDGWMNGPTLIIEKLRLKIFFLGINSEAIQWGKRVGEIATNKYGIFFLIQRLFNFSNI